MLAGLAAATSALPLLPFLVARTQASPLESPATAATPPPATAADARPPDTSPDHQTPDTAADARPPVLRVPSGSVGSAGLSCSAGAADLTPSTPLPYSPGLVMPLPRSPALTLVPRSPAGGSSSAPPSSVALPRRPAPPTTPLSPLGLPFITWAASPTKQPMPTSPVMRSASPRGASLVYGSQLAWLESIESHATGKQGGKPQLAGAAEPGAPLFRVFDL